MNTLTNFISKQWKSISIAKKLYAVIGVMAILIVAELFILWFAMATLSATRAFVAGEGLWSKAQKDAVFNLQRYAFTHNENDYQAFLKHLEVCEGDRIARKELEKEQPDPNIITQGFTQGKNHPDDIPGMIKLLQRFRSLSYIQQAISAWSRADALLEEMEIVGATYRDKVQNNSADATEEALLVASIQEFNSQLTHLEDDFSYAMGEGSRWLEQLLLTVLSLLVITVESVGLTLAFLTSRSISTGLSEIVQVASAIGLGDFKRNVNIKSYDEIGHVGTAINQMGHLLEKSYADLESRVKERTSELAEAVQSRDKFLSIASHELKTPLTSMVLQTQLRMRLLQSGDSSHFSPDKISRMLEADMKQAKRLNKLIDDMLDISRLNAKKIVLNLEKFDLKESINNVVERFELNLAAGNCTLSSQCEANILIEADPSRVEQILENLISNAIKYGSGKPIHLRCYQKDNNAVVEVQDQGHGINEADQERIFLQFERINNHSNVSGLGLGLYIAQQIAHIHHGKLSVQSTPGKGSTFTLNLPLNHPT